MAKMVKAPIALIFQQGILPSHIYKVREPFHLALMWNVMVNCISADTWRFNKAGVLVGPSRKFGGVRNSTLHTGAHPTMQAVAKLDAIAMT